MRCTFFVTLSGHFTHTIYYKIIRSQIETVAPGVLSPSDAQQKYALNGALSQVITQPSIAVTRSCINIRHREALKAGLHPAFSASLCLILFFLLAPGRVIIILGVRVRPIDLRWGIII